jgi:outer membrane protein OmpA-like peptidoglycan-associated protein
MRFNRVSAAALAILVASAPGLAVAASTLQVVLGGEGFDGAPKFAVLFGGKSIGEGTLDTAIDTTKDGRFADAADKDKYLKTLNFDIPDDVFRPDGRVVIKLTNEAHGAAGSRDDRELYVKSVAINGMAVPADRLSMISALGVEPTALLDEYVVISESAVSAVASPPGGSWPKAMVAATKPSPQPAPEVKMAAVTPEDRAAPPVVRQAAAEADLAAGNPDPEGNQPGACTLAKAFQITGFAENSNELTPRVLKALDAVASEIGTQKCAVRISGYSSTEGDFAHNALFSIERAQNALHYLGQKGVKFAKYSANGVGETTQFGPTPGANRRVVITVGP